MSALNVKNDARRMGKIIYCFAHLLGSKILAHGFLQISQQSYKTVIINSTFNLVGKIRESLRFVQGQLRQGHSFPYIFLI